MLICYFVNDHNFKKNMQYTLNVCIDNIEIKKHGQLDYPIKILLNQPHNLTYRMINGNNLSRTRLIFLCLATVVTTAVFVTAGFLFVLFAGILINIMKIKL